MAKNIKTRTISIKGKSGAFSTLFHKFKGEKQDINYNEIAAIRQLLSNEKAKLLHIIKTKQPASIYELAKLLGRDFKAVRHDIKLLEQFGFIELISSNKKGRERLRPIVDMDRLVLNIDI